LLLDGGQCCALPVARDRLRSCVFSHAPKLFDHLPNPGRIGFDTGSLFARERFQARRLRRESLRSVRALLAGERFPLGRQRSSLPVQPGAPLGRRPRLLPDEIELPFHSRGERFLFGDRVPADESLFEQPPGALELGAGPVGRDPGRGLGRAMGLVLERVDPSRVPLVERRLESAQRRPALDGPQASVQPGQLGDADQPAIHHSTPTLEFVSSAHQLRRGVGAGRADLW
jgi:hypothetical protein